MSLTAFSLVLLQLVLVLFVFVAAQSVPPVSIAYKYHPLSLPLLLFLCQRIIILTMPPLLHLPSLPFPPFLSRSFPYPILSLPLSLPLPSRDPTPKSSCEAWGTLWTTSQGPTKPCLQMASGRSWAEYRTSRDRFVEDFFVIMRVAWRQTRAELFK